MTTLLHIACNIRMPQLVSSLLNEHGFKANMTLPEGQHLTPLFYNLGGYAGHKISNYNELRKKVFQISTLLISNSEVLEKNLFDALWYGFFRSAQLLLKAIPRLSDTETGIAILARGGHAVWLRRLLPYFMSKNNNLINVPFWKTPPLHWSVLERPSIKCALLLINNGADILSRCSTETFWYMPNRPEGEATILMMIAKEIGKLQATHNYMDIFSLVLLLINKDQDLLHHTDEAGNTALHYLCSDQYSESQQFARLSLYRLLTYKGLDRTIVNNSGNTAL